jgi:hypothetical protein
MKSTPPVIDRQEHVEALLQGEACHGVPIDDLTDLALEAVAHRGILPGSAHKVFPLTLRPGREETLKVMAATVEHDRFTTLGRIAALRRLRSDIPEP